MNSKSRPARTGIQTCKVFRPIDRRLSNWTHRNHVRTDDKGPYPEGLRCGATGLYTGECPKHRIFCSTGRLAGSGTDHRLQGLNGGVAA